MPVTADEYLAAEREPYETLLGRAQRRRRRVVEIDEILRDVGPRPSTVLDELRVERDDNEREAGFIEAVAADQWAYAEINAESLRNPGNLDLVRQRQNAGDVLAANRIAWRQFAEALNQRGARIENNVDDTYRPEEG